MTELEAIQARHSVRTYLPQKIEEEKIAQLRAKIEELNKAGNLHLQLCEDAGNTYNRLLNRAAGLGTAPSVIACVGKEAEDLDLRVGYYGEQLVLFAQSIGLNTCWTGTYNKKNVPAEVGADERMVLTIAIGYGKDQGRTRKSKDASQVMDVQGECPEWFKQGVEAALLAPTAINQQKFVIRLNADESVEFIDKGGIHSQTDLGIIKYHFEVGSGRSV
ncbi:MAG: nitroreductase family protein [Lachnospiraceae bacterium]|nr:nitroreductase family protein [Lachnospiraceae bacterium]